MVKVSVIIPTYNRKGFLREAICSVLNQTPTLPSPLKGGGLGRGDFELIVIDDGSTDKSDEVIREFEGKVIYKYQESRGASSARNAGIKLSKGEYISFLDSDDLWGKDKLMEQIKFFSEHPETKICYTDEIWIRHGVRVNPMRKHQKYSGWIFDKCLPLCIISISSVMMKRELFDEVGLFDEDLPACEDYDMWLRISARYPVYFIGKKLITKRGGHPDQLSRRITSLDRFRISALEKILLLGTLGEEMYRYALKELERKCKIYAKGCFKRGNVEEGNLYISIPEKYK